MRRPFVLASLALALVGCAGDRGELATIIIYQPQDSRGGVRAVSVNEQVMGDLRPGSELVVNPTPGLYTIQLNDIGWIQIPVQAGKTYFVRYSHEFSGPRIVGPALVTQASILMTVGPEYGDERK